MRFVAAPIYEMKNLRDEEKAADGRPRGKFGDARSHALASFQSIAAMFGSGVLVSRLNNVIPRGHGP